MKHQTRQAIAAATVTAAVIAGMTLLAASSGTASPQPPAVTLEPPAPSPTTPAPRRVRDTWTPYVPAWTLEPAAPSPTTPRPVRSRPWTTPRPWTIQQQGGGRS
jgi:hypothetical protein